MWRYGKRSGNLNDLVYHAQWWGPSFIPVVRENNTLSIAVLFRASVALRTQRARRM